ALLLGIEWDHVGDWFSHDSIRRAHLGIPGSDVDGERVLCAGSVGVAEGVSEAVGSELARGKGEGGKRGRSAVRRGTFIESNAHKLIICEMRESRHVVISSF